VDLFVAMLFPAAPNVTWIEPPAPRSLLRHLAVATGAEPRSTLAAAFTDGTRICLARPRNFVPTDQTLATFRLLALEQAARLERGTAASMPADDPLARDLYLLAEAAAVDRQLAGLAPGLDRAIRAARARALGTRPRARLTQMESDVERLTRALLDAAPAGPGPIAATATPAGSLEWARRESSRLRSLGGRYRAVALVDFWGGPPSRPERAADSSNGGAESPPARSAAPRFHKMRRRPRVRPPGEDEDDPRPGTWIVRADDPKESAEDPHGLSRPADRDEQADPGGLGDSLSDLPEARVVMTPETPAEVLASDEPVPRAPGRAATVRGVGIAYPEWDYRIGGYRARGAIVREVPLVVPRHGSARPAVLSNGTLARKVRRDFERLRPRRETLPSQPDGGAIDLDAYVGAAADLLAEGVVDERFYLDTRRARRDAAVLLLADVSASTDAWVIGSRRVIDIVKEGLVIVTEALARSGDRSAVLAFRSDGPERVEIQSVKQFAETDGTLVQERIALLEPDGHTRVGAAVRHGTALLVRQPVRYRLLLLLSDGRPNDVDLYEGRYGLEDTRQAFSEARTQGVYPYCLTIDREAPRYAPRVFGPLGFALLQRAERLPQALVALMRQLLQA
jgi:nitric oxide reductase NorD protein